MRLYGAISKTPVRAIVTATEVGKADDKALTDFAVAKSGVSVVSILSVNIRRFPDEDAAEVTLWTD